MSRVIAPGATVGVLGSGQLGRMFAIAARRMGYRVHTFSPEDDTPTGQVSDLEVQGSYDDIDAVARFARGIDVLTFEFENVPAAATDTAVRFVPVHPSGHVLHTTQHRVREKTFLQQHGFPVTPFRAVNCLADLEQAANALGLPAVLKTAAWGYDGKGQILIRDSQQLQQAWLSIGGSEALLESFIDFQKEVSIVAARGLDGQLVHFGLIENRHCNHILDVSLSPAHVAESVEQQAVEIAAGVLEQLDVVGVMCVEFFLTHDQELLINELAPRPHNSGHFTFDACVTSQFEQQLRTVCGLRLGATPRCCVPPRWGICWEIYGPAASRIGRRFAGVRKSSFICMASCSRGRAEKWDT